MIVDCFTFWNELDILEIRLNELYDTVDKFVIVEASRTQTLLPKPYYFEENKQRYSKFLDKIIHIKVENHPDNGSNLWNMENFQRNSITNGTNQLNLSDEDIILISDLDEIPRASILTKLKDHSSLEYASLEMMFSAYFLNLKSSHRNWIGTVAVKNKIYKQHNPQFFRNIKDRLPVIVNGGWHFSWCGGYEQIHAKAHSCIEPFDKSTLPTLEEFQLHFENFVKNDNKFFIHLENLSKQETEFSKIDIDETYPKFVLENTKKYSKYIL